MMDASVKRIAGECSVEHPEVDVRALVCIRPYVEHFLGRTWVDEKPAQYEKGQYIP